MSGAGPAVMVHFLLTHPVGALAINGDGLWLMLAIGLVSTVAPAYCISAAIGLIGPERTAMIGNVSPIVTVSLAIGVLGEAFTPGTRPVRRWCWSASGCSGASGRPGEGRGRSQPKRARLGRRGTFGVRRGDGSSIALTRSGHDHIHAGNSIAVEHGSAHADFV